MSACGGSCPEAAALRAQLSTRVLDDLLLDVEQVAALMHLKRSTVWKLVEDHRIPFLRVGRRLLFRASDVRSYLDDRYDPNQLGVRRAR